MEIRPATKFDAPELMRLYRLLSANYSDNRQAIIDAFCHFSTDIVVAVDGTAILGTATLSTRGVPCLGLVAHIDDVVVDPAARGKGVGRRLMEYCLKEARHMACRRVELTSHASRTEANDLYLKLGFELRETNCYTLKL
jgi:ribosomal protein S18 acetylase RimI-like enzyme